MVRTCERSILVPVIFCRSILVAWPGFPPIRCGSPAAVAPPQQSAGLLESGPPTVARSPLSERIKKESRGMTGWKGWKVRRRREKQRWVSKETPLLDGGGSCRMMVKSFFVLPVIFLLLLLLLFLFSPASADGEEAYLNWVKHVGEGRKGSASGKLENRHKPCLELTVEKKNSSKPGSFISVQAAIDSLPPGNSCRVVIYLRAGVYAEKVTIPGRKAYVTLLGEGRERTIIQWGDTADGEGPEGRRLGTFGSATFAVNSPFFVAMNVTFKNVAPPAPAGAEGKQAVALRISGDAAFFLGCGFHGGQDTLYDHRGRHFFKDCFIEGSVDFVFGDGRSLYEGCRLHAVAESYGAVAAQKRESFLEETGFSFLRCRVTGSGALYLGRAWGTFSRVVFAYSYLDKIVVPDGWYDWGDRNRQTTVFFGQYRCSGPGASLSGRVRWSRELTAQQAEPFLSTEFVDGSEWLEP